MPRGTGTTPSARESRVQRISDGAGWQSLIPMATVRPNRQGQERRQKRIFAFMSDSFLLWCIVTEALLCCQPWGAPLLAAQIAQHNWHIPKKMRHLPNGWGIQ